MSSTQAPSVCTSALLRTLPLSTFAARTVPLPVGGIYFFTAARSCISPVLHPCLCLQATWALSQLCTAHATRLRHSHCRPMPTPSQSTSNGFSSRLALVCQARLLSCGGHTAMVEVGQYTAEQLAKPKHRSLMFLGASCSRHRVGAAVTGSPLHACQFTGSGRRQSTTPA